MSQPLPPPVRPPAGRARRRPALVAGVALWPPWSPSPPLHRATRRSRGRPRRAASPGPRPPLPPTTDPTSPPETTLTTTDPPDPPSTTVPPLPDCTTTFQRPSGLVPPGYVYSPTIFDGTVADPQPDDTFAADAAGHATYAGELRTRTGRWRRQLLVCAHVGTNTPVDGSRRSRSPARAATHRRSRRGSAHRRQRCGDGLRPRRASAERDPRALCRLNRYPRRAAPDVGAVHADAARTGVHGAGRDPRHPGAGRWRHAGHGRGRGVRPPRTPAVPSVEQVEQAVGVALRPSVFSGRAASCCSPKRRRRSSTASPSAGAAQGRLEVHRHLLRSRSWGAAQHVPNVSDFAIALGELSCPKRDGSP